MDRSEQILSATDELRAIRREVRLAASLDGVRSAFERVQLIRKLNVDDLDVQMLIADVQQEVVDRGRILRGDTVINPSAQPFADDLGLVHRKRKNVDDDEDIAEIPQEVPKLDRKSWQIAVGLAAFFTIAICSVIFYLIQTARRINFAPDPDTTVTGPQKTGAPAKTQTVSTATPTVSLTPTLRLYTDLVPGSVSFDNQADQMLADGEFTVDNLKPGTHSVKVSGRSGSASFSYAIDDQNQAPRIEDLPSGVNAMVVLVAARDGQAHLVTDDVGASVTLDNKLLGDTREGGLDLLDLGKTDHNLEVSRGKDKQKFVLTYTAAPTLTVFVKSDPSTGTLTVMTGQDEVSVFIGDFLYRQKTDLGQVRIPLKVGVYRIRVHKDGFIDPPATRVEIKRAEEASVAFTLQATPMFAILQLRGAQFGTSVSVDNQPVATVGADGTAKVLNVSPGEHSIQLQHDQEITKKLTRTFEAGTTLTLSGADVALDRLAADNKTVIPANPGPPLLPPPTVPQLPATPPQANLGSETETVRKGGGFVPYQTPRTAGHYYFQAHTRLGGLLKHGKLQWYAGFKDKENYVLFTVDGKHAGVREVLDGKVVELGKVPFEVDTDQWVQVDVVLKADSIQARVKSGDRGWSDLTAVASTGRDFTKDGVGVYIPSNDEVAIANFRFSSR